MRSRIAAILFDVDGVLIDSADVHRRVWSAWAERHGLDRGLVWQATVGHRPEDTIALTAPELDPVAERRVLDALFSGRELDVAAMPGAAELLVELGPTPWALVTSGSRAVTLDRFTRLGLPLPRVLICGEDVVHGKPDPECYLRAARELGVRARDCLVVEDAPAGIAGARAAGCYVIAVTTTCSSEECAGADEVFPDLSALAERARDEWSQLT